MDFVVEVIVDKVNGLVGSCIAPHTIYKPERQVFVLVVHTNDVGNLVLAPTRRLQMSKELEKLAIEQIAASYRIVVILWIQLFWLLHNFD